MKNSTKYIFVIDTKEYSGNFERALCAHCTGRLRNCGVGDEYSENFHKEEQIDEDEIFGEMDYRHDDHGGTGPVSIWQNNKGVYNSVALFFSRKPTEQEVETIKRRAATFNETSKRIDSYPSKITILGFRLLTEVTTLTEEAV